MITDVANKGRKVSEYIMGHDFRRYLVKGDFEVMPHLKVFERYLDEGRIDEMVSINVASSKSRIDERAMINIGRNYRGLAKLLKEN
jgi:hypothetical protein